jgi:hypothetical protein
VCHSIYTLITHGITSIYSAYRLRATIFEIVLKVQNNTFFTLFFLVRHISQILQKLFDNTIQCDPNMYLYDFRMKAFTCFGPLRPSSEGITTRQGN